MQGAESNFYLLPKHFFPAFLIWRRLNKLIQQGGKNSSKDCQQGFWVIFTFGRCKRARLLVRFVWWLRRFAGLSIWAGGQLSVHFPHVSAWLASVLIHCQTSASRTTEHGQGGQMSARYVSLLAPILRPKLFSFLLLLSLITPHPIYSNVQLGW